MSDPRSDATLRVYQDADLDREILGLQVIQGASGWKLDHRVGGYSDRAVALAMACTRAVGRRGQGEATISVPSGQIRVPGFLCEVEEAVRLGLRRRHGGPRSCASDPWDPVVIPSR